MGADAHFVRHQVMRLGSSRVLVIPKVKSALHNESRVQASRASLSTIIIATPGPGLKWGWERPFCPAAS